MRFSLAPTRRTGWTRFVLLLLSVTAASLVTSAQTKQLRLVSTAWPPFTNPAGQPRFALDLVEAALGRFAMRTTTTFVEPAAFTSALLKGQFDGSAAAWKDAEREKALVFSQPYLENRLILVGRHGTDVSAATFGALKGKKVAIVGGYSYGDALEATGPTFVRSKTEEDSLQMLLNGSVDYTLMDELVVQYITTNYAKEAAARLQLATGPLLIRPLYFALRRSLPDAESLITRFNSQLRSMISDGTYHKLLHVDWINADVDGDGITEYVPKSTQAGKDAPQYAYTLLSTDQKKPATSTQRFYIGGNIYNAWSDVPESYKVSSPSGVNDPDRSTITYFRFSWK
jgi:polar amino acid transport system substrate-binding protein